MNLSELRTFLSIVETGSLVRASEALNVTQSTVTARLKTLEDTVGQTLINRSKSGATLTAAGMRLLRYADTISELWRQAQQEASLPEELSGVCNLACETDLWPGLGERFFVNLQNRYPATAISVWLGSQSDVAEWLGSGRSDIAFTYRAAISPRQSQIELTPDQLTLVATHHDSLGRGDAGYVFVEGGQDFGRDHASAFTNAVSPRLSFGTATMGLQHLLRAGGSAYVPLRMVADAVSDGSMFTVPSAPVFERRVYLTSNKSAEKNWNWFDSVNRLISIS